jgi:hypothetical protein
MADDPPIIVSWVGEQFLSGSLLPLPIVPIEGREPLIHDVHGIPRCHVRFGSLADIKVISAMSAFPPKADMFSF